VLTSDTTEEDTRAVVERLFLMHGPGLLALARTLTGSLESGDDLVQDVFIRVLEATRREPGYVREPSWPLLRQILVRLAAQRRRGVGREIRRMSRIYERPAAGTWETDVDVISALLTLPPRMRAAVVLRYMEDLSVAEVAAALGTASGTVAAQLQTARRRLRERLAFDVQMFPATSARRDHRE
jgi:RNA polymerase sigma-70 factor, ECF subfamily